MPKEFLTYDQQMQHLNEDKKITCGSTNDKIILCRNGYFNLINGYKSPFVQMIDTNGNHIYIGGTTVEQIYEVKKFDEELKMHILKYITKIEEEIRALTAYKFDQYNDAGKIEWYRIEAYDPSADAQKIISVISESYKQIESSRQLYKDHYLNKHKIIPTWILIKAMNFSTFIKLLEISKNQVKDALCDLYGIKERNGGYDYKLLIGSLHWLRKVRNACAHNERLYGMQEKNHRVIDAKYFPMLPKTYSQKGSKNRDRNLMDLIVYLRYYLTDEDYTLFVEHIKRLLCDLKEKINPAAFDNIRGNMGIKDIDHLDILSGAHKKIAYDKFCL